MARVRSSPMDFAMVRGKRKRRLPPELPDIISKTDQVAQDFVIGANVRTEFEAGEEPLIARPVTVEDDDPMDGRPDGGLLLSSRFGAGRGAEILAPGMAQALGTEGSILRAYQDSSAGVWDALRPVFDRSGMVAFSRTPPGRQVLRFSRVAFRAPDTYFDIPVEAVATFSLFFGLVRGGRLVSNVCECSLRGTKKSGVWRPETFHEFDFQTDGRSETDLLMEVVGQVRVPSLDFPFELREVVLASNSMQLVRFNHGVTRMPDFGKTELVLGRSKARVGRPESEARVRFYVTFPKDGFQHLPADFIAPALAMRICDVLRHLLETIFEPRREVGVWQDDYLEPIMFRDVVANERSLMALCAAWQAPFTEKSLLLEIRRYWASAFVLPSTSPYSLAPMAGSTKKLTTRVAGCLERGVMPAESFVPFHTDELRGPIWLEARATA